MRVYCVSHCAETAGYMISCVINVKNRMVKVLKLIQQYQKRIVVLQCFFEIGIGIGNAFCRVYWYYWYCQYF